MNKSTTARAVVELAGGETAIGSQPLLHRPLNGTIWPKTTHYIGGPRDEEAASDH